MSVCFKYCFSAILIFFWEGAAANTWQLLHLLRSLTVSLMVSTAEHVLTQRKQCIDHLIITVPIYVTELRQYEDKELGVSKDSKPAFKQPPSSRLGGLLTLLLPSICGEP